MTDNVFYLAKTIQMLILLRHMRSMIGLLAFACEKIGGPQMTMEARKPSNALSLHYGHEHRQVATCQIAFNRLYPRLKKYAGLQKCDRKSLAHCLKPGSLSKRRHAPAIRRWTSLEQLPVPGAVDTCDHIKYISGYSTCMCGISPCAL
jgi:hypothetical protein